MGEKATTSIPIQLEELMRKMLFVARIPPGKKPNFYTGEYDDAGIIPGILRSFQGQSRSKMCEEIKDISEAACQTLVDKRGSEFEVKIIEMMTNMKKGIAILQETYKSTEKVVQSLEIQKILLELNLKNII